MKTKIIYISGGEVFPPHQVRAAFDAVRSMLGLDQDTVIFGVPVDSDNVMDVADTNVAPIPSKVIEFPLAKEEEKAEPKRKKREVAEQAPPPPTPILSVIDAVKPTEEPKEEIDVSSRGAALDANPEPVKEQGAEKVSEEKKSRPPSPSQVPDNFSARPKNFRDDTQDSMLVEATDEDSVQSIEDIFAGIPPLTEDRPRDLTTKSEAADEEEAATPAPKISESRYPMSGGDDATLSKLAAEFVASQSGAAAKSDEVAKGGKIGRLKNILPFKKKEKSEPSVLGDLFGWAGVAANDDSDNFAMPDFFQMGTGR